MTEKQFLKKLGNKLTEEREKKHLDKTQLGKKMRSTRNTVARIESAKVNSTIAVLRRASEALNIPLSKLLNVES